MSSATGATELAPSDTRTESPTLIRYLVGFGGLFVFTLGVASVVAAQFSYGVLGAEWGSLCAAVGLALLLVHALADGDVEVRRAYGAFGGALLLLAVGVGVFPASPKVGEPAVAGALLLPWGALCGGAALMFLLAYARHETKEPFRGWVRVALFGTGGLLLLAAVGLGVFAPTLMAGPGAVFGVLGLLYLGGYFAVTGEDGVSHRIAQAVAALGAVAVVYALFRTVAPDVLFKGPAAIRNPDQTYNWLSVGWRAVLILVGLSGLLALRAKRWPAGVRFTLAAVGVGFAGVMLVGALSKVLTDPAPDFLIPGGLILLAVGLASVAVGLGVTSEWPVVVLAKREIAAYFLSPIAYVVLFGNAVVVGLCYWHFAFLITSAPVVDEPIVKEFLALQLVGALTVGLLVAAVTMRTFSEEKRTGALEVLLTAPVNDWAVVLSKYAAAFLFFLLCWVPAGVCLLAFRYAGGVPYDYRPLLGYAVAVSACGAGWVAFGLFVSSLTKNQIVAAVLTFAYIFAMLLTVLRGTLRTVVPPDLQPGFTAVLAKFDFLSLWGKALNNTLLLPEVCVHLSLAVFWVFLTAKVLGARKWA